MVAELIRARYAAALESEVERWEREPIVYGYDDCLTAVANIDHVVIGIDTAAEWRGRYIDLAGARKLMGRRGVYGAASRAARLHGWQPINPRDAQVGDRGLVFGQHGLSGAMFDGTYWTARDDPGVTHCPNERRYVRCAWSIECLQS